MDRVFFRLFLLKVIPLIYLTLAPVYAFSQSLASQSHEYLRVQMEQESYPVRSEAADFGADIGKVFPGLCVNTTGQKTENHGTGWTEIRSLHGWYDWNNNQTYHQGWVPSSILSNDPDCTRAWNMVNEIYAAVLPGLRTETEKVCGDQGKAEAFIKYTMNQPTMIRWLDRHMPEGVAYEQIDYQNISSTRRLSASAMIIEFAGIPFTLYSVCGPDAAKFFLNAFEFSFTKGETRNADRIRITMDTGEAETLSFTMERNIFKLVAQVDRGWVITQITRRPFKGE